MFDSIDKQLKKIKQLEQLQINAQFNPQEPASTEAAIAKLIAKIDSTANAGHKEDLLKATVESFSAQARDMVLSRAVELREEDKKKCMKTIPKDDLGVQLAKITALIQDLQYVDSDEAGDRIKRLARSLNSTCFNSVRETLTDGLSIDDFISDSEASGGGMCGSAKFLWPEDDDEKLGIVFLLIDYYAESPRRIWEHGLHFFGSNKLSIGIQKVTSNVLVPFERDLRAYIARESGDKSKFPIPQTNVSNKVFVVHGHDEGMEQGVARFLEQIGLEPIILHEQSNQGATIIEKFEEKSDVGFAIILMSPDDEGGKKGGELEDRPRQNVVLEAGWFMGRLGRKRTMVLKRDNFEMPSDLDGLVYEPYNKATGAWRSKVVQELNAAGYNVSMP